MTSAIVFLSRRSPPDPGFWRRQMLGSVASSGELAATSRPNELGREFGREGLEAGMTIRTVSVPG
jgi:hypothetical protein